MGKVMRTLAALKQTVKSFGPDSGLRMMAMETAWVSLMRPEQR